MSAAALFIAEQRGDDDARQPGHRAAERPVGRAVSPAAGVAPTAPHLTEAQLTALWRGRRFPDGALVTQAGVPVRVISEGRPGRGPGPDFRGAAIAGPAGVPLHGDVELHVRSSDFRAHGHHTDPAYRDVILHVVFDDDAGEDTALPGGGAAPVVALAPWVARRANELQRWLERPPLWREPCHDAVMRLGAGGAGSVLDAEGDRRFEVKVARAKDAIRTAGVEQALHEGLLEALGYGGNAPSMRALARVLPWARLHERSHGDGVRLEALLIGVAGLLPSQRRHDGPVEAHVATLEREFARARLPALQAGVWKLWGVRPENAPARRIAAAAALLARLGHPAKILAAVDAATVNEAIAPLLIAPDGYWRAHYDVCAPPCHLPPALVGRSRALEIIINVVLPVACCIDDAALAAKALALFAGLPRPSTGPRSSSRRPCHRRAPACP